MKLLYRKSEQELLRRQLWLSENKRGRLSLVTGRRGTGKTSLVVSILGSKPFLYFGVRSKNETLLLEEFIAQVKKVIGAYVPATVRNISALVAFLMDKSTEKPFTLVLDGFDDYIKDRMEEAAMLRQKWDETREDGRMNFIIITHNKSVTRDLFHIYGAPFLNRLDANIELKPFTVSQLKELLMVSGKPILSEDVLTFFSVTGGMPTYVRRLNEADCFTKDEVLEYFFNDTSAFLSAGEKVINTVLGKNKDVYLSILQLIASGYKTQGEIEAHLGGSNVGGHLAKLETEYDLITKKRPVMASEVSRNVVRFEITDMFLLFWLRYIERYRTLVDIFDFKQLRQKAADEIASPDKEFLRRYFMRRFSEENPALEIGGAWKTGDPAEIDILAVDRSSRRALAAAVEKKPEYFKKEAFLAKIDAMRKGSLKGYSVDSRLFTLRDI